MRILHTMLRTGDLDRSIAFYTEILGMRLLRQQGIDIHHITRDGREGFKAGALRNGLSRARGDFVAIFDADFVPPPDFLLRAMPFFVEQPRLGLVQGRFSLFLLRCGRSRLDGLEGMDQIQLFHPGEF